jgi:hypothetical protein
MQATLNLQIDVGEPDERACTNNRMEEDTRGSREEVDFGAVLKAPIAADSMLLMQGEVVPAEGHTAWRGAAARVGGVQVGGGSLEPHIGCDFEHDWRSTWQTRCETEDHE